MAPSPRKPGGALGAAALLAASLVASSVAAQPALGGSEQYIIYGEDDRQEFYEVASSTFRDLARRSIVALVPPRNLSRVPGGVEPAPITLGDQILCVSASECLPMCPDERYLDQPSVGECSGVLIDDDLVLTAGHCFIGERDDCNRYRYIFDFHYEADGRLSEIDTDDVYGCESLVLWQLSSERGAEARDYAVVKLDRPVDSQREPAALRIDTLKDGDGVSAIGFPIGLPLKVDRGGVVKDARGDVGDYFTATTDTFVGNSGSGLFDGQGRLAGHLVVGGEDFVTDEARACLSTVVVGDDEIPPFYERAVYVETWRSALCGDGYPSERLCGDDAPPIKRPGDGGAMSGGGGAVKSNGGCSVGHGSRDAWPLASLLALALGLWFRRQGARA